MVSKERWSSTHSPTAILCGPESRRAISNRGHTLSHARFRPGNARYPRHGNFPPRKDFLSRGTAPRRVPRTNTPVMNLVPSAICVDHMDETSGKAGRAHEYGLPDALPAGWHARDGRVVVVIVGGEQLVDDRQVPLVLFPTSGGRGPCSPQPTSPSPFRPAAELHAVAARSTASCSPAGQPGRRRARRRRRRAPGRGRGLAADAAGGRQRRRRAGGRRLHRLRRRAGLVRTGRLRPRGARFTKAPSALRSDRPRRQRGPTARSIPRRGRSIHGAKRRRLPPARRPGKLTID